MNYIIKRTILILVFPLLLTSCIIQDAQPEDCITKEITVDKIEEGSSFDVVFKEDNGDTYYINRGLEQGLTMEELNDKILNKNVTLQLYKFWFGTSEHISQLSVDGQVIFTEFD